MGFFDAFPVPAPPAPPPESPPWFGPPRLAFGTAVPERLVLAHTESAVVVVERFFAFPTGLEFTTVVARFPPPEGHFSLFFSWSPHSGTFPPPPEVVRLAVVLAGGKVASNLVDDRRAPPEGPRLHSRGGSSGAGMATKQWWLWPLPPPGPVRFVVEWPEAGVPETSAEVDGDRLRAAAGSALELR